MIWEILPYVTILLATLAVTLALTPIVRWNHRRLGMVDKPDPRRINKVPIPRGGGVAIVVGVIVPYLIFHWCTGRTLIFGMPNLLAFRLMGLSVAMALLGLADDRYSLKPKLKLLGQVVIASLVWGWVHIGFGDLFPALPVWIDAPLTVFWIVGAVNAFNLIDGLDGLASGLALIAVVGMAGALFFIGRPAATLVYFALAGSLIGFLRYNYNPASIFLGDSGSMFLGFVISTLPLTSHDPSSLLVSIGVPMLSMGVPIFDTSLAILRRFIRRQLAKRSGDAAAQSGKVMAADSDHLHHRILRAAGLNQRKAAWVLYFIAMGLVATGMIAMYLRSQAAGLWLVALSVAAVVIFKDAKIELFDAGRLLSELAHSTDIRQRRYFATMSRPLYVVADILCLTVAFFVCSWATGTEVGAYTFRCELPVNVVAVFFFLVLFRVYATSWSRAQGMNYLQMYLACVFGSVAAAAFLYYGCERTYAKLTLVPLAIVYSSLGFLLLQFSRYVRAAVRDLYYKLDCTRVANLPGTSRVLVYGAGLRYRAFTLELTRKTGSNSRVVVGLLDDNLLLKGKYVGGLKVFGTINDAPQLIQTLKVDAVVLCCEMSDTWLKVVREVLEPTGVRVTHFQFEERELANGGR